MAAKAGVNTFTGWIERGNHRMTEPQNGYVWKGPQWDKISVHLEEVS